MDVAKFLEYSVNAPDLSISIAEGVAKIRFKCQECHEAKKFAAHCFNPFLSKKIITPKKTVKENICKLL